MFFTTIKNIFKLLKKYDDFVFLFSLFCSIIYFIFLRYFVLRYSLHTISCIILMCSLSWVWPLQTKYKHFHHPRNSLTPPFCQHPLQAITSDFRYYVLFFSLVLYLHTITCTVRRCTVCEFWQLSKPRNQHPNQI